MARRKGFTWYFGILMVVLGWPSIILIIAVNLLPIDEPHFLMLRNSPTADWYSFAFFCVVISTLYWTIVLSLMQRKKRR
jgi:hypothetical protein